MKKILGLDLGTTSIGWAYVLEAENENESSQIKGLGVRVNPLTTDEKGDFEKGKSISVNADRTLKRSMRRNLNRYQDRRKSLIKSLKKSGLLNEGVALNEDGKDTTHSTYQLRSKAAKERVEKDELCRIFLMINKKRGYKSSRKLKTDDGQEIDGMSIAKRLYDDNITPGQYCLNQLINNKRVLPDFYRSDLKSELNKIWGFQKKFYPELLKDELYDEVEGKNKGQTWKILERPWSIEGILRTGSRKEKQLEIFQWRNSALSSKMGLENLAIIIQEINGQISGSSGYLGEISDRSKALYFNNQTVGEYLYEQLRKDSRARLKNQVFYRQDYLDEFEKIWETQKRHYNELTEELKLEIRDTIIFYQRKLKSQKGLISFCEFEQKEVSLIIEGKEKKKIIGARVVPKSSLLFQEYKIWKNLNDIVLTDISNGEKIIFDLETKRMLFEELNIRGNLKSQEILKLIGEKPKDWEINFKEIEGNRTNQALYEAYMKILEVEGHDFEEYQPQGTELKEIVRDYFNSAGINPEILNFDGEISGLEFEKQPSFQLWHVLYSFEEDPMKTNSVEKLHKKLVEKFGFSMEQAKILSNVIFQEDYSNLSSKAIRKIFPYMKENQFDKACQLAGYNHSHSITKEENEKRTLTNQLELLSKNSLRNPVVEKILNQMVNVVNAIIKDESFGKPDEIRLELARELKKSAKERKEMTSQIGTAQKLNDKYRQILKDEFGIKNPTRNDIIRYKLYLELKPLGFKTLYSQTYISREKIFDGEFDIEHIIPKSRLFDDSYSNKTLESRAINIEKGNDTAADFIVEKYGQDEMDAYKERVIRLNKEKENPISRGKMNKLLMTGSEIPDGFIERDLRNTQYISKKAQEMLLKSFRVVDTTTGVITDKLREDWGLTEVMRELNIDKYRSLGLTKNIEKKNGSIKEVIQDWSKRNDHRHHAMDALTVAFTTHGHVQYLNYMNARKDETHKKHGVIYALENKLFQSAKKGRKSFIPPMDNFRDQCKLKLDAILISHKAKNKVVTRNINKIKVKGKVHSKIELTPRGQLHKETIYGKILKRQSKEVKIGGSFNYDIISQVANVNFREAILKRFKENGSDPKKAFSGANSLAKKPIYTIQKQKVPEKVLLTWHEDEYVIRKEVNPTNFSNIKQIEKIVDRGIKRKMIRRLEEYSGNAKEAFSDIDKNPIWLDKRNGIPIKSVRIKGVNNAESLHDKNDHHGKTLLNSKGAQQNADFVQFGNNHHVAIYQDAEGKLHEMVVSFFEAVRRSHAKELVIDKSYNEHIGWKFLFTMKQNEMFIFPSENFNPKEIDIMNPINYPEISKNIFRVQKVAPGDYSFRHHLETQLIDNSKSKGFTWKRLGLSGINGIIKVRINHLGKIVKVGEY